MTTIVLPPDVEDAIAEEAARRGVAPETVAVDGLRRLFIRPERESNQSEPGSLLDSLAGHIGTVDGRPEAFSEQCGDRFADGLVQKYERGHL